MKTEWYEHTHCPYCCGPEFDYHTSCFYIRDKCPEAKEDEY